MNTANTMNDLKSTANEAADLAKNTASKVAADVKTNGSVISTEVKNFLTDVEEMVSSKISSSTELNQFKSDISSYLASAKAAIEATSQQAVSQAKQKAEGVNTYVHHEPWKAIGVSFAVGLLLGAVVSRR